MESDAGQPNVYRTNAIYRFTMHNSEHTRSLEGKPRRYLEKHPHTCQHQGRYPPSAEAPRVEADDLPQRLLKPLIS
jgi:hypothetical protein